MIGLFLPRVPQSLAQEVGEPPAEVEQSRYPVDPDRVPRPTARAVPIEGTIRIDGKLDEPQWEEAEVIDRFIQNQPDPGHPATERTEVRILHDDEHLYIGARLWQSDMDRLMVRSLERDFPGMSTRDMDVFAVTLDTFLDRRNSFIFLINPYGGLRDGQTFNDSRELDFGWDGVVHLETGIHDWGWTVEMAVPWSSLRFDPELEEQTWGLNLLRRVRGKNEDSYWAPVDRRDPVHRMSRAGTLTGIEGIESGRNLRVKPFTLARRSPGGISDEERFGGVVDGGLDLKYGLTPQLTLDLTWRTEFSQVEVDQEQVNLTRFPLFFPEQREFFVENSGSFSFGDVTERNYRMGTSMRDFTLFHSRRIGLSPDGRPVPIRGGARATGRAGGFELGVLNLQTRSSELLPPENFAVARLRRNFLGASDAGVMLVNRQATDGSGGYNRSWGADLNLHLLDHLIVNSYLAGSRASDPDSEGNSGRVSVAWRDRIWNASAMWKRVGDGFDPGVGFVRRTGIQHAYATLGAHPRPELPPLLFEVNPYVEVHYVTDPGSELLTRNVTAGIGVEAFSGGGLEATLSHRFERLQEPFRVQREATVPVGDYSFREASARYASDTGRSLSGSLRLTRGGFFDGDRTSVTAEGEWQASPHLTISGVVTHNRISLQGAEFTADVVGARVNLNPSTRFYTTAFVQYNEASEELVTNVRLNLIHAPLSDVFLVFNERRRTDGGGALERMVTLKVTRMLSF